VDYLVGVKNSLRDEKDDSNIVVIDNALWQLFLGEDHRYYTENYQENS
jgi:hypothetical protein